MPELTLNIFDGDAFGAATMTSHVNMNIPFVPGFLGSLGLFSGEGVYTTTVAFDDENGNLSLIETSPRGSAPGQAKKTKGNTRHINTVRLAREAQITADEISGVRVLGTGSELQTAERLVWKRIDGPVGLKAELSFTREHMYMGAIDGLVYDADGTTEIWNYFSLYGVARPAAVNFALSTATAETSIITDTCMKKRRMMVKALNGFNLAGAVTVNLCGDNFFDAMYNNKEVIAARKLAATGNMDAPEIISANKAYSSFRYANEIWVNYRGDEGGKVAVPTDEGRSFMMGVPGLFMEYFAPADTFQFVNTEGLPSYVFQRKERQTDSMRVFELQSNPLTMCLRPLHMRRLTKG
ncbi:major capsid protein [uncultured Cohaesibacter sp.]|uniref:major capsid protein n=1 Tax=uncultured Cohaesibacter sp. TaxID=1002546 RepID=UPI0029C6B0AA|nr:major capsid protein [uncultured Cohaesibacter sp.]